MASFDIKEQYDKIYRYCYFKLSDRDLAEDITQETFLKFYEHYDFLSETKSLKYLYTIAGNLCIDEYRRTKPTNLEEDYEGPIHEDRVIENMSIKNALSKLTDEEREILLLRYANDVQVSVIGKIYKISRFAARRKILSAKENLEKELRKEGAYEQI